MDLKYFDAHTHVQFAAFDDDRDAVVRRSLEAGVGMNVVGTQEDTSRAAIDLANKYDGVWATIGLHPVHTSKSHHDEQELGEGGKAFTSRGEAFDMAKYEVMAREEKVIAIGECGLDYYRLEADTKKLQKDIFEAQIELANKVGKPLMLHIREAYEDSIDILKNHRPAGVQSPGDVHFFAGSWDIAKQFLDLGFTLSFTGVVTFTHDYDEVVRNTPLDMILSETDAPYVTPVPHRGKRNEPIYIPDIVRKIAEIKNLDEEQTRAQLMQNVSRVFSLPAN
jgi:TatD DNase family protein